MPDRNKIDADYEIILCKLLVQNVEDDQDLFVGFTESRDKLVESLQDRLKSEPAVLHAMFTRLGE